MPMLMDSPVGSVTGPNVRIESGVYHVEEEPTFSADPLVDPHEPLQEDAPDPWLDGWAVEDISKAQKADPEIARYLELVTYNKPKPERSSVTGSGPMGWKLFQHFENLAVQKGLLYIVQPHKRSPSLISPRLVTPRPIRQEIFNSLHGTRLGGHLGINRSVERIQNNFFWPGLYSDTLLWCSQCPECAQSKEGPMPKKAGLKQQPVGMPLERMAADIVGPLPMTEKGNLYILVVVDYFTKWAEAFPLTNKSSMTVADSIVTQVMCRIGTPYRFHSDQGGEFDSNLFRDVCELLDVEKTRTTPYRPQSDGLVERLNRTIKQMLKIFVGEHRDDWDDHLPYLMMAYRATPQESTGCSPNLLMLGREIRLPIEVMSGIFPPNSPSCPVKYVQWVQDVLAEAFEFARKSLEKNAERQKKVYNLKSTARQY